MNNDAVNAARALIGTPYVLGYAQPGVGCDCIGVVEYVWREVRGTEPPMRGPVVADYYNDPNDLLFTGAALHLTQISRAKLGSVLLIKMKNTPGCSHIAICTGLQDGQPHTMVHAHDGRMVRRVVETTLGRRWLPALKGIFEI